VAALGARIERNLADKRSRGLVTEQIHTTRMRPKRDADLLDGGSLYWVIKGLVQVRQPLLDIGEGTKEDGTPCCMLILKSELVGVRPTPRRPFQGWRYLAPEEAPDDLTRISASGIAAMPPRLRKQLAELGLL
jgi:hypothetical protein